MKRPVALYLIAIWLCWALLYPLGSFTSLLNTYLKEWHYAALPPRTGYVAMLIVYVWLVVGLLRLKLGERWICMVVFGYLAAAMGFYLVKSVAPYLLNPSLLTSKRKVFLIATLFGTLIHIIPSVASIWYLSRRSFREFARQFVEERQRQKLERQSVPSS